jgi:hypothetical protein
MVQRHTSNSSPENVNRGIEALPMREARRPLECTGKSPCWVIDGRSSLEPITATHNVAPRCTGCGGKIRTAWKR